MNNDSFEEFLERNIIKILIIIIVIIALIVLYFVLLGKKKYEIVSCETNGGNYQRGYTYENTEDSCTLTINSGSKASFEYKINIQKVSISLNNNINMVIENEKISDETKTAFSNPYCKIVFNFPCNDIYIKDTNNRIYENIDVK